MPVLVELRDDQVEKLLQCKNTDKRVFNQWKFQSLLNEAIYEFWNKYHNADS